MGKATGSSRSTGVRRGFPAKGERPLSDGEVDDGPERVARAVRSLPHDEGLWWAVFMQSPTASLLLDGDGLVAAANAAAGKILGRPPDTLLGVSLRGLTRHGEDMPVVAGRCERRFVHGAGHPVWAVVTATAAQSPHVPPGSLLVSLEDATGRRSTERRLLHAAMHDSLTNLPNRRLLQDRLETALARARRSGAGNTVAVLFIDLDDFKQVNDDLGHDAGDDLLVAVARNIHSVLRSCDTVARLGGDEFVVICEDVAAEGDVRRLVRRLRAAIRRPVLLRGRQVSVGASVGVSVPGRSAVGSNELVRLADLAMYRAKGRRDVDFVMADDSLSSATGRAPADRMVAELRHAIQADELVLHYQPVVRFDGSLLALEALVRWPHPRLGLLPPGDFLHLVEGTELAKPFSDRVLCMAVNDAASWHSAAVRVSVNVWAAEAGRAGFAETVAELLGWAGLSGHGLCLEMRERDLAAGGPALVDELEQLRLLGVALAVDDFGTGGSSLTDLRTLPVGALKIDRTFVAGSADPAEAALVGAVAAAARALGRHAIAAGVETPEQLRRLKDLGYRSVQGHLTGRPAPLAALRDVVRARRVAIGQS